MDNKDSMDKVIGLLFGAALIIASIVGFSVPVVSAQPQHQASATVEVLMGDEGHGSGVHLGNGYILTANHVADPNLTLSVVDTDGHKHTVETLWTNKAYDVALLRITDWANVSERHLACRALRRGEHVSFEGNPLMLEDVTTYGRIAQPEVREVGYWKEGVIVDAQIAPGMSGGPAIDAAGAVIGINVGGFTGYAMGIIVPSSTVCTLLARQKGF